MGGYDTLKIQTVTILGANGSMGRNVSGIFASFGNAKVYMMCRDLKKAEKAAHQAALSIKAEAVQHNIVPCDYSQMEECLADSDLIFESVREDLETKLEMNRQIARWARPDAVVCTGSSGLSIQTLAYALSPELQTRYMGLHMFNPPYNMPLCEVIPTASTDPELLAEVKRYASDVLRRTVVQVKDAPAFLGNRIGFYFINEAMQYAERYQDNGGVDYIDAILGQFTGRSMAPINTADFVGLDVHKAIVDNLYDNTSDYVNASYRLPAYVQELIDEGKLGRKAGQGLYKSVLMDNGKRRFYVYDIAKKIYRDPIAYTFSFKEDMMAALRVGDYETAFRGLVDNRSAEARLCVEFLLKYIVYSLYCARLVGQRPQDADDVMAAGFNWAPPLAVIDALGGAENVERLVYERLPRGLCDAADAGQLLRGVPASEYDYRRYFKAKK